GGATDRGDAGAGRWAPQAVSERNYYQVLGISRDASATEIRAAFVRLSKRHHPDLAGHMPARLAEVRQAYRCLADAQTRAAHDRAIAEVERAHLARQARIQRRL